ncbi:MAG: NADP transhydrogenase subunit alpha [Proteobacteria bacterium SG_bin7]|nr:MAG: NADP transhydrogenase subunit alpha [Proteobacteria bacterium SG_bin7]
MQLGIPNENRDGSLNENRVSATPDVIKKIIKAGFSVVVEDGAGMHAGFFNEDYVKAGAKVGDVAEVFGADVVFKINPPTAQEAEFLREKCVLLSLIFSHENKNLVDFLKNKKITVFAMEKLPRTSRAQSMDVLSSQANIAGYRAVIEAGAHYGRFLPLMMTSAGMAKPARVIVLGAGVAGLQAIATAKRLGANVEAYDVRPEVREQIESLGGKFIELKMHESGAGTGGYAKELSEEGKKEQQRLLTEKLKTADIIVATAAIPGRKAPTLITKEAVDGMRRGSVVIDLAAATGGNCECTQNGKVITTDNGIKIVGTTNYPSLVPADASLFFGNNLYNFLVLLGPNLKINFEDDLVAGTCITYNGEMRQ